MKTASFCAPNFRVLSMVWFAVIASFVWLTGRSASAQTSPPPDYLSYYEGTGPYCLGSGGVTAGDPVDVATGGLHLGETLGTLPGRVPFTLSWGFVARDATRGPLGLGTFLSCDYFIRPSEIYSNGSLELFTPGNRHFVFRMRADGTYVNSGSPEVMGAVLSERIVDAGPLRKVYYMLRFKSGVVYRFLGGGPTSSGGALISIHDPFGNVVNIDRNMQGYATRIWELGGREIKLLYNGGTGRYNSGQLVKVILPLGREWRFTYLVNSAATITVLDKIYDPMNRRTTYVWNTYSRRLYSARYPGDGGDSTGTGGGSTGGTSPNPGSGGGDPVLPPAQPVEPVYPPNAPPPTNPNEAFPIALYVAPIINPVTGEQLPVQIVNPGGGGVGTTGPGTTTPIPPDDPGAGDPGSGQGDPSNPIPPRPSWPIVDPVFGPIIGPPVSRMPTRPPYRFVWPDSPSWWSNWYAMYAALPPNPQTPRDSFAYLRDLASPGFASRAASDSAQPSLLDTQPVGPAMASASAQATSAGSAPATAGNVDFIGLPLIVKILDRYDRTRLQCWYDTEGRVTRQQQADGGETTFAYESRTTTVTYPTGQWEKYDYSWYLGGYGYSLTRYRDSVGQDVAYEHGTGTGLVTAVNSTFAGTTRRVQMTWDLATGNLLNVIVPTASGTTRTASAVYDPVWNVPVLVQDFAGIVSSVELDPVTGAPLVLHSPRGNTKLFYSPQGDLLRAENPLREVSSWEYTPRGEVKNATDPEGNTTQFGYDTASRLTMVRAPGAVMVGSWPGQVQAQYLLYNAMDQVVYAGNLPNPDGAYLLEFTYFGIRYDYDDEGNLVRLNLPGNVKHEWAYDAMDRVVKARDPWGKESLITYANGRVASVTDRAGSVARYSYRGDGQVSGVSVATKAGALVSNVGYQYDARLRLQRVTDSVTSSTYGWRYDSWDRCIGEDGPQGSFSWELDDLGRRTRLLIPNRLPTEYVYGTLGELLQVRQVRAGGGYDNTKTFGYDSLGRLANEGLYNMSGSQPQTLEYRTYGYTPTGRLSNLTIGAGAFSSARTLSYDAVGRLTQEVLRNGGISRSNTFGYDVFDRLRLAHYGAPSSGPGAGGPGLVQTFDYDTLGNRLRQTGGGLTTRSYYDTVGRQRLIQQVTYQTPAGSEPNGYVPPASTIVSDLSTSYDVNGNLTTLRNGVATTGTYTWNALGQLTGTSGIDAGGNTGFGYDVLGRRTVRTVATTAPYGSAVPLWDGWVGANPFDRNGAFAGGVKDARGSTVGASISTGLSSSATVKFDYLAYGEVSTDPAGMDVSQVEWAGMQMDNRKLYYARNRYYSPQMGRFISEDPIRLRGGINSYMYCGGDPVNYTDPLGLQATGLEQIGQVIAGWTSAPPAVSTFGAGAVQEAFVASGATAAATTSAGTGAAAVGSASLAAPVAVIAGGGIALYDLGNFAATGRASGPFTRLGQAIGNALFPMELEDTPTRSYKCNNGWGSHSSVPGSYVESPFSVDMTGASARSDRNAAGFPRNGPWFWRQLLRSNPELFSAGNTARIAQGRAPLVDAQWVSYNPAHRSYIGDGLIHHHVDQGAIAVGLPNELHLRHHRALHYP